MKWLAIHSGSGSGILYILPDVSDAFAKKICKYYYSDVVRHPQLYRFSRFDLTIPSDLANSRELLRQHFLSINDVNITIQDNRQRYRRIGRSTWIPPENEYERELQ